MTTKHDEPRVYRSLKLYEEDESIFQEFLKEDPSNECARLIVTAFEAYFHGTETADVRDGDDRMMRRELQRMHQKAKIQREDDLKKIGQNRENAKKRYRKQSEREPADEGDP